MGMTIDEVIYFAECLKNNYTIDFNNMESFCEAVTNTMRKYQKIQEIINNTDYIQEDVIRYKMICGVVRDGNDQISKSTSKQRMD